MPVTFNLTKQRRVILEALDAADGPLATHELGEVLRQHVPSTARAYYDRANSVCRRLADLGLIERHKEQPGRVATWSLTPVGREVLDT
jgi:hypothetical protein